MASAIKRGDTVECISGSERGRGGKVLVINRQRQTAIVEGLNMRRKHQRKSQDNPHGGIIDTEGPIHLSNLRLNKSKESDNE